MAVLVSEEKFAAEMALQLNALFEKCAVAAESCAKGVAVTINGETISLGVMCVDPAQSQRQTANAIAAVIRNMKS